MYKPINIKRGTWYGSNYWESYSKKVERTVRFFSDLEYENWILIETNPKVKTFCEQPLKIQYLYDGKKVESIFDMWVCYYDGYEEFIEVKYSHELDMRKTKSLRSIKQTNVQAQWCKDNDINYRIVTEKEIRSNMTYLNNLKQMLYFIKHKENNIDNRDRNIILDCIQDNPTKINSILNAASKLKTESVLEIIYTLILDNKVFANIADETLSYETGVWLNE